MINPLNWAYNTYEWTLKWSEHRHSVAALCGLAFVESIFFPVPADILLLVLGTGRPRKALYFAFLTSLFSVLGAVVGYCLGYGFWLALRDFFFHWVFSPELFERVRQLYEENVFWAVFTAAFTPIPFKVFTLGAGVFEVTFLPFLLASIVGRSLRFFLVGGVLYFFGTKARILVEKYFNLFTIFFILLFVLGFFIFKWL